LRHVPPTRALEFIASKCPHIFCPLGSCGPSTGPIYVCLSVAAQASNCIVSFHCLRLGSAEKHGAGVVVGESCGIVTVSSLCCVTCKLVSLPWVVEEITLVSDTVEGINFCVGCGFRFGSYYFYYHLSLFLLANWTHQVFLEINFACLIHQTNE